MALDLTPVLAAEMKVSRLELPDDIFPILEESDEAAGYVELLTLNPADGYDWDLTMRTSPGSVPKQYLNLRIIDIPDLKAILDKTHTIVYDGMRYKVSKGTRPFGLPRVWLIRLDYQEDVL